MSVRERCLTGVALLILSALDPTTRADALSWERVPLLGAGDAMLAVAVDPSNGRLAVGDARGASVRSPDGVVRRALRRGPVRDLAFLDDGDLLVATDGGLYRVTQDGRITECSPAPGAGARAVARISATPGAVAVATGAGAFVSAAGRSWQRVREGIPGSPLQSILIRRLEVGTFELWMNVSGRSWRIPIQIDPRSGALELRPAERQSTPQGAGSSVWLDLASGPEPGSLVALTTDRLLQRGSADSGWEHAALGLPPGATPQRLAFAQGRFWLATDRGLLSAAGLEGPWQRGESGVGNVPAHALASHGEALYVANDRGLMKGERASRPFVHEDYTAFRPRPGEPSIRTVQRAALSYLSLEPERMRELAERVARRGYYPQVDLSFSRTVARSRNRDYDESFVSGGLRELNDWERDQERDFRAILSLTWDLGDAIYHPETIDVSREARELIELRDDVLDELTQLYFERRRVLESLARLPPGAKESAAEAIRLRLRADELAAGLDAWTGGWFSRAVPPLAP